jgi:hypothetical protein
VRDATYYLTWIKALIVANPKVVHWSVVREEAQGDTGIFRYRLSLCDDSFLEMFEFFQIQEAVQVIKCSFHWQNPDGQLRKSLTVTCQDPRIKISKHSFEKSAATTKPVSRGRWEKAA